MKYSLIITAKKPTKLGFIVPKNCEVIYATGTSNLVYDKNLAALKSTGDILIFIDDDVIPDTNFFDEIAKELEYERHDFSSCVTARILSNDCGQDMGEDWRFYTRANVTLSLCSIYKLFVAFVARLKFNKLNQFAPSPWGIGHGTAFAIRRTAFEEIEGFNPKCVPGDNYSACEDIDLFYRLLHSGKIITYQPHCCVWHNHGRTIAQLKHRQNQYTAGNRTFIRRNLNNPYFWIFFLL